MVRDSKALFDMVTRNIYLTERRLIIDMASIREPYRKKEIARIVHVAVTKNPAETIKKVAQSAKDLDLMVGKTTIRSTQWVERNSVSERTQPLGCIEAAFRSEDSIARSKG